MVLVHGNGGDVGSKYEREPLFRLIPMGPLLIQKTLVTNWIIGVPLAFDLKIRVPSAIHSHSIGITRLYVPRPRSGPKAAGLGLGPGTPMEREWNRMACRFREWKANAIDYNICCIKKDPIRIILT